MKQKRIGVFAGSFDPLTNGHLDLIERSSRLFDEVIVLIAINTSKQALFTPQERIALVQEVVADFGNVVVDTLTDGLVAHYFEEKGATAMIRGVRNATDFEYEFSIATANQTQSANLETVVLYTKSEYHYLSSSLIKEIAYFDGDISKMVPSNVEKAIKARMKERK